MVRIERLSSVEQLKECEAVQRSIWGSEPIPATLLRAIQDNGGLVLGAYDEQEKMVGMLVGFLGRREGKLIHYSHICGVLEEARYRDIGFQLKLAQREFALSQGLDLVLWTFDPLQGANAYFNLHKLGAVCRTYYRNYYGLMEDRLNAGLESDRFLAEWWIRSERVEASISGRRAASTLAELMSQGAKLVTKTRPLRSGMRAIISYGLDVEAPALLIEIPDNINALKEQSLEAAREWRRATREIFEHYFAKGYIATDLLSERAGATRRNYYLLERG
ncbi:MAG: hypothetical protein C4339_04560 [Nitrososphaerota archaeon]